MRDPDAADVELVRLLTGPARSSGWLAARLAGVDLRRKLDSLVAAGLVLVREASDAPPLAADERERFSRQLPYLAELGDDIALQHRLRASGVAVIGCGGIGTWVTAAVACLGIGRVVLVDDDVVELSNLNRQILYGPGDIGAPKVAAAAGWLSQFDRDVEVVASRRKITGVADVEQAIAGMDAVVLAADSPPFEIGRWVNAACVAARVPFVVAGQVPPILKVGPTFAVGESACLECHETALRRQSHAFDDYVASRKTAPAVASTLGPASCVVGGMIGVELLHLLTGRTPATTGAAILVDMRTLEVRREPIQRDPDCRACKHLR